jgi:hypothetical protein
MTPEEEAEAQQKLQEIIDTTAPKGFGAGLKSGVNNIVAGAVGGAGIAVLGPTMGLAVGLSAGGLVGGIVGLAGGAVIGAVGAVGLVVGGAWRYLASHAGSERSSEDPQLCLFSSTLTNFVSFVLIFLWQEPSREWRRS